MVACLTVNTSNIAAAERLERMMQMSVVFVRRGPDVRQALTIPVGFAGVVRLNMESTLGNGVAFNRQSEETGQGTTSTPPRYSVVHPSTGVQRTAPLAIEQSVVAEVHLRTMRHLPSELSCKD